MKKLLQRVTAVAMSLITVMAISVNSFALNENADNHDGEVGAWEGGLPGYNNTANEFGYRISAVNGSTGESLGASDLTNGNMQGNKFYGSTGTDKNSSGQLLRDGDIGDIPAPLHWTGNSFQGNGGETRDYFKTESNGEQNIAAIAKKQFSDIKDFDAMLDTGVAKIVTEPIYSLPVYSNLPVGTTREGGLKVVQGVDSVTGAVYNYWANSDGTPYYVVGTIREYIAEELRPYGGGSTGGYVSPVIKQTLKSFLLSNDDMGLASLSEDELNVRLEQIILSGDLSQLGLGMYIYSSNSTPPQQPQQPQTTTSTGSFNITQSRITRSIKLSDVDDTLFNYQFTWEVPKFDESIKDHMYGYYAHSSGATITDKTNVVIVTEEKKPDDKTKGSGIIGMWTFPTHSDPIPEYRQTWSDRNWGDQSFSTVVNLNPVEYRVTAVRQKSINDIISLINYRSNPNASAVIGATSTIVNGNKGDNRASNGGGSFAVDVEFKAGITDSTTVAIHSDKFKKWLYNSDGSPKLDNAGNHKWTTETKTKTDTKTTTVKSGADKLQMTLNVNWNTYSGNQNSTTNDTTANKLTQHFKNGKQETWLELNYGNVSFYPYVRMQFDTVTQQGSQVYVAGKYQRLFTANEHVGVIFNTSKNTGHSIVNTKFGSVKGKISLQSNQWSTHATAVKNAGSNCVLPGGAVFDLAILKDDRQTFTVESIKPILVGDGLTQVNATKTNIIELQCVY